MEIILFRSKKDGFLYYQLGEKIEPIEVYQDNVFKLNEKFLTVKNITGQRIVPIKTDDGIPTYKIESPQLVVGGGGAKRPSATSVTTAYAQTHKTNPAQTISGGTNVSWDGIKDNNNVSLATASRIEVSETGVYQIEWKLLLFSIAEEPA